MAMMGGQGQGGTGSMEEMMRQHHPAPQPSTPATPEAPKQP
jgi:hypothetical protein